MEEQKAHIVAKTEDYNPYYKFGLIRLKSKLEAVPSRFGTKENPVLVHLQSPIFERILKLLQGERGIYNVDADISGFDEVINKRLVRFRKIAGGVRFGSKISRHYLD